MMNCGLGALSGVSSKNNGSIFWRRRIASWNQLWNLPFDFGVVNLLKLNMLRLENLSCKKLLLTESGERLLKERYKQLCDGRIQGMHQGKYVELGKQLFATKNTSRNYWRMLMPTLGHSVNGLYIPVNLVL